MKRRIPLLCWLDILRNLEICAIACDFLWLDILFNNKIGTWAQNGKYSELNVIMEHQMEHYFAIKTKQQTKKYSIFKSPKYKLYI
jgi:hypothetical protein